jgi:hypothetical protein
MLHTHLANNMSSATFADDLLCPTGDLIEPETIV